MKKNFVILVILSIFVNPVSIGFTEDHFPSTGLRDVKAPVYFPFNSLALLLALCVILIIGVIGFIWFLRKKRTKVMEEEPVDTRLAWEIAYEELKELEKSSLLEERQFKAYYSRLSNIVRRYFENRFNIRAPEMTTEEFLWSLDSSHDLADHQKDILKKFLSSCDIVKFAKYIPRMEEGKESFQFAWNLVEETNVTIDHNSANVSQ